MAGAGWIDVEAHFFPPETPDWVILYPPGQSIPLDTPEWRDLRWRVEEVATAALREARPLP
jgi:hypothetical protein